MGSIESGSRRLIAFHSKGSEGTKPSWTVSVNIAESADDDHAALIHSLFKKHFPDA